MDNYTYSTAAEGFINNQEFLTNDQGTHCSFLDHNHLILILMTLQC